MLGAPPIPAQPGGKVSERGLGGNRKPNPIGGNGTRSDRRSDRRRRRHPLRPLADRLSAYRRRPHRAVQLALRAPPWRQIPAPRSEEHTSELQSLMRISYAVFCLKKKIQ